MFPKLKHAGLCRIISYVVVIGAFFLPPILLISCDGVPEILKVIVLLLSAVGLVIYILKNILVLMALDTTLAALHCQHIARKRYPLPKRFRSDIVKKRIQRYGKAFAPQSTSPKPDCLRYTFRAPFTIYSRGIVKVVAAYHAEYLEKESYQAIMRAAMIHSKAVLRKGKRFFLDKQQQKAPFNHTTVIVIFAKRTDEIWLDSLYDQIQQSGCNDGWDTAVLPCIIDEEKRLCIFDSMLLPFTGFGYPAQNRGYKLIRKLIFGGRLRLSRNPFVIEQAHELDNESLWSFWREIRREFRADTENEKTFKRMNDGDVILEQGCVYIKSGQRGTKIGITKHETHVEAERAVEWIYPKRQRMSNAAIKETQDLLVRFFEKEGLDIKFE